MYLANTDSTSISAPDGLTVSADPRSGQPGQFSLFSDSWLQLQSYVGSALELPIAQDSFEQKYGTVGGSQTVLDAIAAMRDVQDTATAFGNPKTLRAALISDPTLLAVDQPPIEIYTHTVWLGQRVHRTAGTLVSGYQSVLDGLRGMSAADQVTNLKQYLFDPTLGPIPLSKQMSDDASVLIKKIGAFEKKMNAYNEKLSAFTSASSTMMSDLDTTIGTLKAQIADLANSRDAAFKAWRDFTIAAATCSVGCLMIGCMLAPVTLGLSVLAGGMAAIATGVGLGVKAAQCRAQYNALCGMIADQTAEENRKIRLRSDLGDFDKQMALVAPAMSDFLQKLQTIEGVWTQMNTDMIGIHNSVSESNVGSLPFLVEAKARNAIDSWKALDASARQFTVDSLVDYTSHAFGEVITDSSGYAKAA